MFPYRGCRLRSSSQPLLCTIHHSRPRKHDSHHHTSLLRIPAEHAPRDPGKDQRSHAPGWHTSPRWPTRRVVTARRPALLWGYWVCVRPGTRAHRAPHTMHAPNRLLCSQPRRAASDSRLRLHWRERRNHRACNVARGCHHLRHSADFIEPLHRPRLAAASCAGEADSFWKHCVACVSW